MTAMKILILGGTGHVSGTLAKLAVARGHQVWTVTRGQKPFVPGCEPIVADRKDTGALETAIRSQQTEWDLVVDCICYDVSDMRQDIALFPALAGHLVFISTDFVYDPEKRRFPQPEDGETLPPGEGQPLAYGRKKRRCELELTGAETGGMAWTIFRPCHIYGAPSELGCLPLHGRDPKLIETLRAGKALSLVGGGHFLQQPVFAGDLAAAILSAAGNTAADGEIFNLAGPDIIESREYYRIISDLLGTEMTIKEIPVQSFLKKNPDSASFVCHRIYDLSKLESAGITKPATLIAEGLRRHLEELQRL